MQDLVAGGGLTKNSSTGEFVPNDSVKFRHAMLNEKSTEEMLRFHETVKKGLCDIRNDGGEQKKLCLGGGDAGMLKIDNLFELLRRANSKVEASAIEDILREAWLVHENSDITNLIEEAAAKMSTNDFEAAMELLEKVIAEDPDYVEAYFKLATCHHLMNTPEVRTIIKEETEI